MPELEAIERVKQSINSLADEPAILAEQGIALEDVAPVNPASRLEQDVPDEEAAPISENLDELLSRPDEGEEIFADMDEIPSMDMSDSLDLEEGGLDLPLSQDQPSLDDDLSELDDELPSLDDERPSLDDELPSLDEELPSLDEELPSLDEELPSLDEELPSLDEELSGNEEDQASLDDDLSALEEELPSLDDSGMDELDSLEEISLAPEGEELPEVGAALDELSSELEEAELSGELDGDLDMTDDFGLNEIGDDFLDDMDDDSEGSFSLDDLGQEFTLEEEEKEISSDIGLDLEGLEKSIDDADSKSHEDEFELTSEEMKQVKEALYHLPRNLKLELEELMADPDTPVDDLEKVIQMLIRKAPIKSLASQVGKIRGKKIEIPRGYQKLNVQEYAQEQNALINQFRDKVWPRVLTGLLGFFILWLLFLISFNFIYRPLKARSFYDQGLERIAEDEFDRGDYLFDQAYNGWEIGNFSVKGWPRKERYYQYAEAYKMRRTFDRASMVYRDLLLEYPREKEARLDYADMLARNMARFQEAEKILLEANPLHLMEVDRGQRTYDTVPVKELAEIEDFEQLLKLGDVYFLWGESDPAMYEKARYIYSYTIGYKRNTDEVSLRLLRYFLRMDNREQIERWVVTYKDKEKVYAEERFQSEVFSETAGWLLDRRRFGEAEIFLDKAIIAERRIPDVHYQYSRYFRMVHNRERERGALTNALGYLTQQDQSQKKYIFMKIDCYKRLGEMAQDMNDMKQAERNYLLALSIFEEARRRNLVGTTESIGELYYRLGEIHFSVHQDYDQALAYYNKAQDNFYDYTQIRYRKGYIYYTHKGDYSRALLEFYKCSRSLPQNRNILFAMANTLYLREDYSGAVSHYERLLTSLREEEQRIGILLPEQKEEHLSLILQLMKVFNNLGAAQYKMSERSPNRVLVSLSLSQFTYSSEYYDRISRDQDTMVRSDNPDLGYLNRMTVLRSRDDNALDGEDVVIFKELLSDMDQAVLSY